VLLGYSQASVLPIAQAASLFGVYGVSMLVAAVNGALVVIVIGPSDRRRFVPAAAMLAVVLGIAAWGALRLSRSEWTHMGQPIRVGLVQGNVDQAIKWDAAHSSSIFEAHLRLTDEAIAKGAEFVMWPESSMPFLFEEHPIDADRIRTIVRTARVPMLFGSDQVIWRDADGRRVVDKIYNAAFLVQPDGATGGIYRKIHLVPFGEYVPLKRLLFFAAPLVEAVSDFTAGESLELLPVGTHRVGTAICYEIIYADLVRRSVAGGSEMITTITNDAWFGATSAPYQHFAQASMRAIENGRYPRPIGQHRHQRHRRSLRPRAGADADFSAGGRRRLGAVPADVDVLHAPRRRRGLCLGPHHAGLALRPRPPCTMTTAMATVDEMMRRYEDLSKRATDLRSYL
jgi:apolipoprotein N-acyltransferase